MDCFEIFCKTVFICCIVLVTLIFTTKYVIENTSSPVEKNDTTIDSLITVNDSIKLKVEHLDSIKNAKIIEVSTLDNDSTLKLFYKLVSE